jgi:hypothetical protein
MTTTSGLTQKQQTFINAYLGNGENATEAYKQSGYRVKNDNVAAPEASKLLRNPKVSQEITRLKAHELALQAKKQEKLEVTQDWLITQLAQTVSDARAANQFSVVMNSLVHMGRLLGIYVDKREVKASLSVDSTLTQLDTAHLLQALKEARPTQSGDTIDGDYREIS